MSLDLLGEAAAVLLGAALVAHPATAAVKLAFPGAWRGRRWWRLLCLAVAGIVGAGVGAAIGVGQLGWAPLAGVAWGAAGGVNAHWVHRLVRRDAEAGT